jgi:hypothetical protein
MDLRSHENGPSGFLLSGDDRQRGRRGTTDWTSEGSGMSADAFDLAIAPVNALDVRRGEALRLSGDVVGVSAQIGTITGTGSEGRFHPAGRLRFHEGSATLGVPPGDYVIKLAADWPEQGNADFFFRIRVT